MADAKSTAAVNVPSRRYREIVGGVEQFRGDIGVSAGAETRAAGIEGGNLVPIVTGFEFKADRDFRQLEAQRAGDDQPVIGRQGSGGRRRRELVDPDVVLPVPAGAQTDIDAGARHSRSGKRKQRRAAQHKSLQFHGKTPLLVPIAPF